jgi:hypothetical protein
VSNENESERPRRRWADIFGEELGIDPEEFMQRARAIGWGLDRILEERKTEGWAERFRAAVADVDGAQIAQYAQREVQRVLATGLAALAKHPDPGSLAEHPTLQALAANYDPAEHGGRLILGPTGIGKTVAAVAAVRAEAFRLGRRSLEYSRRHNGAALVMLNPCSGRIPIAWARALELPLARLSHGLGDGEAELVKAASVAQFLVLDDLGWESRRAGADDAIGEVIARRYDAGLATLATSGLFLEQVEERYGDSFIRRICEAGGMPGKVIDVHPKQTKH